MSNKSVVIKVTIRQQSVTVDLVRDKYTEMVAQKMRKIDRYDRVWSKKKRQYVRKLTYHNYEILDKNSFIFPLSFGLEIVEIVEKELIEGDVIERETVKCVGYDEIDIELKDGVAPRPYQVPIIPFLTKVTAGKALPLQTGKGKTFCGLWSVAILKRRTLLQLLASDVHTWVKEYAKMFKPVKGFEDFVVVDTSAKLKKLMMHRKNDGRMPSVIVVTLGTLRSYLTSWESGKNKTFPCSPEEFYGFMGIGYRIVDEAHLNMRFQIRHNAYFNVESTLYLTATMKSNYPPSDYLYEVAYPLAERCDGLGWDKYIDTLGLGYTHNGEVESEQRGSYNHGLYEENLFKDYIRKERYLKMVLQVFIDTYAKEYSMSQRCILYFQRVKTCEIVTAYLSKHTKFKCGKYTAVDGEEVFDNDVIVTTLASVGKGRHIPNLTKVINFVSVYKAEATIQAFGRILNLTKEFPKVSLQMVLVYGRDHDKQSMYHREAEKALTPLAKSFTKRKINHEI